LRKLRRTASLLALAAVVAGACASASAEEAIRGQSKDLAITIASEAGENWCEPMVRIRLEAANSREFSRDFVAFQQMVGRIRAIVQPRCQTAEGIRFTGLVGEARVVAGEMLRLTNWRYVPLDPAEPGEPLCTPALDASGACATRRGAYTTARDLFFASDAPAAMRFTAFLDPDGASDLEWKVERTLGKINVLPRQDIPAGFDTAALLVERILQDVETACRAEKGQATIAPPEDVNANLVVRSLRCRSPKADRTNQIVLAMGTEQAMVFTIGSFDGDDALGRSVVARILAAADQHQ
jgi:hypothetical protein